MVEHVVKAPISLNDGKYQGVIKAVEERNEPFEYTDIYVETKDENGKFVTLKTGFPTYYSTNSRLGKFLEKFLGRELVSDEKVDPEKILVGKKIEFMILNEKTEKGVFAKIIQESIKPIEWDLGN